MASWPVFTVMTSAKTLLLILHTPGGLVEAAQTIVDYLRSKFSAIDVLVPTYAMSAGTMIALGCDRIVMEKTKPVGTDGSPADY